MTLSDLSIEDQFNVVFGYATVLTYMFDHGLELHDDDDLKDAFVEIDTSVHLTDEDLEELVEEFRELQETFVVGA